MLGSSGTRCSVSLLRAEESGIRAQPRTERAQRGHEKGLRDKVEAGGEGGSQAEEEREHLQPRKTVWSWRSLKRRRPGKFRALVWLVTKSNN